MAHRKVSGEVIYPSMTIEAAKRSMGRALAQGWFLKQDEAIVQEFLNELQAQRHLSDARVLKLMYILTHWRRFITCPYPEMTYQHVLEGLNNLRTGKNMDGIPFKQNTIHDYIQLLKRFILWLIENKGLDIPERKIRAIQIPPVDTDTTHPEDILTYEEVLALIKACKLDRDRAIISVLYESGCRIGELIRLTWKDLVFDKYGIKLNITDKKTKKRRYSRLTMSTGYLVAWKNNYPGTIEGNAPVFVDEDKGPIHYSTIYAMLHRTLVRAKIKKKVHLHLFRKSRITHMVSQNYQESVIKESCWGNINTKQFKTYVKLSQEQMDNEFLTRAGIKPKEEESERPLTPKTCGDCHFQNGPTIDYCGRCGAPLTKIAEQAYEGKVKEARRQDDFERIVDETVQRILKEIGSTKSR